MTEPTAHMNHDHVYTGLGDNPARCYCGGVHQPDTTQRDELRDRITQAIAHAPNGIAAADAVVAIRDEELERLRGEITMTEEHFAEYATAAEAEKQRLREWCKLQGERFGIEQRRAEAAEAQAADRDRERIFENSRLVQERQRAQSAEAKLAAVRELHDRHHVCCDAKVYTPDRPYEPACPTIRATGGEDPNARAREEDHTGAAPEASESGTVERADGTEDAATLAKVRAEIDADWPNALGRIRAILDGEYT